MSNEDVLIRRYFPFLAMVCNIFIEYHNVSATSNLFLIYEKGLTNKIRYYIKVHFFRSIRYFNHLIALLFSERLLSLTVSSFESRVTFFVVV